MYKGEKLVKKRSFLNKVGLFLGARKNALNNFKSRIFPIKYKIPTPVFEPAPETAPEPAPSPEPTKYDTSKLKLREKFKDEIITVEKYINDEIF